MHRQGNFNCVLRGKVMGYEEGSQAAIVTGVQGFYSKQEAK